MVKIDSGYWSQLGEGSGQNWERVMVKTESGQWSKLRVGSDLNWERVLGQYWERVVVTIGRG